MERKPINPIEMLDKLVKKINTKNSLSLIEQTCTTFLHGKFSAATYTFFLASIATGLDEETGNFIGFMQSNISNDLTLPGNKEIVSRLKKLKQVYGPLIGTWHQALSRPNAFAGILASGFQGSDKFYYHFNRKDGEYLPCEFTLDEAIAFMIQIQENICNAINHRDSIQSAVDIKLISSTNEKLIKLIESKKIRAAATNNLE